MSLTQRADQLLRDALGRLPQGEGTQKARKMLEDQRVKLAAPLRIALAGRVSSGKSTLVNALVRAPVAVTGRRPVTLAVSVLQYAEGYAADSPSCTVHFTDESVADVEDLASLAKFTARAADGKAQETRVVDFVQVLGRYPCLRQFDLVDTPGFDSPHGEDTDEALRAIGATHESVMKASSDRLRSADAIIAVLQHAVSGPDADVLRRFHSADGNGFSPTAITSMAVLTKVEEYWRGVNDPLDTARKHARRIMADQGTRRLFHRVLPVCSKVAEAAAVFADDDFPALKELAAVEAIDQILTNVKRFARDEDLPLAADCRQRLAELFHPYGIWLACRLIRDGVNTAAELRRGLEERSGMPELRSELAERFAGHSGLIKAARAVQEVRGILPFLPPDASDRDRDEIARAVEAITSMENTEPAFAEFDVLRRHYAGELRLEGASEATLMELERAAGEHGVTVAARLGLPADAEPEKLAQTARELLSRWSGASVQLGPDGRMLARVMKRRYEELYDRVRRAQAVLADVALFGDESVAADGAILAAAPPGPGADYGQDEPVLVVDLGTTTTSAILLDGGRTWISEPSGNENVWPTSVCEKDGQLLVGSAAEHHRLDNLLAFRTEFKPDIGSTVAVMHGAVRSYTAEDLAAEVLKALRDEAVALREDSWAPFRSAPRRLVITIPVQTDSRRRDAMIRAGQRAGFTEVELLPEPVAAAFSAGGWPPGSIVLVYDLGGGTFDVALVRTAEKDHEVIGTAGLADGHGGRDIDAEVFRHIQPRAEAWLQAAPDRAAERDEVLAYTLDAAVRLKEGLSATDHAVAGIVPGTRAHMSREQLAHLTESLLRDTVDCCAKLVADRGRSPRDIDGVLLVGGSTRMPMVLPYVKRHLDVGGPVRRAKNPVTAVVEGAASWAENAASRGGGDDEPSPWRTPLSWSLPEGRATLERWLVERYDSYPAGATLARVRRPDNTLYDLRVRTGGRVEQQHVWPGGQLYSGSWVVTARRTARPGDLRGEPRELHNWTGDATALAISPEGRRLAVACREPSSVLIVDTVTGGRLSECRVDGRVLCLAWDGGARPAFGLSGHDGLHHSLCVLDDAPAGAVVSPRQLAAQATAILDLAYLPGGRQIAVLCGKGVLRIADTATGKDLHVIELSGSPGAVAVSRDGQRIASSGGDSVQGDVYIIERSSMVQRSVTTEKWTIAQSLQLPSRAHALRFGPNRLLLAGGGEDGRGYLSALDLTRVQHGLVRWPTRARKPQAEPKHQRLADERPNQPTPRPEQAADPVNLAVHDVTFSGDNALFAVAAEGLVWVGDTDTGGRVCAVTHSGTPTAALSPDGHWLYTAGHDGVRKWTLTELEQAGDHVSAPNG